MGSTMWNVMGDAMERAMANNHEGPIVVIWECRIPIGCPMARPDQMLMGYSVGNTMGRGIECTMVRAIPCYICATGYTRAMGCIMGCATGYIMEYAMAP